MFRIDSGDSVPLLPVLPPPGPEGYFSGGDPTTGRDATIMPDWWANQVQEEILNVITAAGIVPDKTRFTQLLEALDARYAPFGGDYLPITGGTLTGPLTITSIAPTFPSLLIEEIGDATIHLRARGAAGRTYALGTNWDQQDFYIGDHTDPLAPLALIYIRASDISLQRNTVVAGDLRANTIESLAGKVISQGGQPSLTVYVSTLYAWAMYASSNNCCWGQAQGTGEVVNLLMQLDGFGNLNVVGNFGQISDRRFKEAIEPWAIGLDVIRQLEPCSYQFTGYEGMEADPGRRVGLVADDVAAIAPDLTGAMQIAEEETAATIELMPLLCALVNAVKELDARYPAPA